MTGRRRANRAMRQNRPGTLASSNKVVRRFKLFKTCYLDNASATWGDHHSFYLNAEEIKASQFSGINLIQTYDRYRIKEVQLFCNSAPTDADNQAKFNGMTIFTSVDLDGSDSLDSAMVTTANNCVSHTMAGKGYKCLARFTPRLSGIGAGGAATLPAATTFISTQQAGATWKGINIYATVPQKLNVNEMKFILRFDITVELVDPIIASTFATIKSMTSLLQTCHMTVQPDSSDPADTRSYVGDWTKFEDGSPILHLVREDGESGSLTYSFTEYRECVREGNSGKYFNSRPAIISGWIPPDV